MVSASVFTLLGNEVCTEFREDGTNYGFLTNYLVLDEVRTVTVISSRSGRVMGVVLLFEL